jgi:hypothetical protein
MSGINLIQINRCENITSQFVKNGGAFEQAESMFEASNETEKSKQQQSNKEVKK